MAKKKLFTEDVDQKLPFIRKTGEIETPERLAGAMKKAAKLKAEREKKKIVSKPGKHEPGKPSKPAPGKLSKSTRAKAPTSSQTGREIYPGRYEKIRYRKGEPTGEVSRQGERDRSELLLNAIRATFHMDQELLRELKERAKQEGRGLSELANIAIREYLHGEK